MEENFSFGYWLRRQRLARDLRQGDLAAQLRIATVTLRKLEADARRPSLQVVMRVADVFGLDAQEAERLRHVARADLSPAVLPLPAQPVEATGRDTSPIRIRPRRLPRPLTPFIGRTREITDLAARLTDSANRLVTLIAPGGMGKTRLALATAEHLQSSARFPSGMAFVALAPLNDPAHLESALADALGLPLDATDRRSPRRQLLDFLREKGLLLILDNCEHLRDALAEMAQAILSEAPNVTMLATSRERLGLRAEQVVPLDGMLTESDGIALFLLVAQAVQPDLAPDAATRAHIAAICVQLGGMPLAIELAAGWADTLSLREIAAEIAQNDALLTSQAVDLPTRHRSIRVVCDTSWVRLTADEQMVFARIAVFRGGATRRAIQNVTAASLAQLQTLVGKAFLRYDPERERYAVHEVLRQYAAEQLHRDPSAADDAQQRHAAYYLTALADRETALKGVGQHDAFDRIAKESENLHAAWGWASTHGALNLLAAATTSISLAYEWLGRSAEGLAAFQHALATPGLEAQPALHARFLAAQAQFALLRGDSHGALALLGEAQSLLAHPNIDGAVATRAGAEVHLQLGHWYNRTDYQQAEVAYRHSLTRFESLGDQSGAASALAGLGEIAVALRHDYTEAERLLAQSAQYYRDLGNQIGLSSVLITQSLSARYLGRISESLALAREAYQLAQSVGNVRLIAQIGNNLGAALFWDNQNDESYTMLHHTLTMAQELGLQAEIPNIYYRLGVVTTWLGRYTEAHAVFRQGFALARQQANSLDSCGNLTGLSWIALVEGAYGEALQFADAAICESNLLGEEWFRHIALANSALAARHLGQSERVRSDVVRMLRIALTIRAPLGWCHWAVGLALADNGADSLAATVLALAERDHMFTNIWSEDVGLRELRSYVEALPADVQVAARAHWADHDYWTALEELLAELETRGWG